MKVVASHKFTNDKEFQILYLTRRERRKCGVPESDTLVISRIIDGTSRDTHIRPDEAIILIQLLAEAVNKTVKDYEIGLKR